MGCRVGFALLPVVLLAGCPGGVALSGDAGGDAVATDDAAAPDDAVATDDAAVAEDSPTDLDDVPADRGPDVPVNCEPAAVADNRCDLCEPDFGVLLGVFWNGRECFEQWGCAECVGEGCDRAFDSLVECQAVQSGCPGALCESTGGTWFPGSAGFCGFPCGVPSADACAMDSCDCGPGRNFDAAAGCVADPSCGFRELCAATRGIFHPEADCFCGAQCGVPRPCGICSDACDCGPYRVFDAARGCIVDPACEPGHDAEICVGTGGTWRPYDGTGPCVCGHFVCGGPAEYSPPCCSDGCDCGWLGSFDPERGCVRDGACVLREEGKHCTGWAGNGTCRPGLVCCEGCGAPPGCPSCRAPCCPTSSSCMDDGCHEPPP